MSLQPTFKRIGEGSSVQPGGIVQGEDYIVIGRQVQIQAPYWLTARPGSGAGESLSIGDGCRISTGLTIDAANSITLERKVFVGANVYLTDKIPFEANGGPFQVGYTRRSAGELIIGEGTLMESGVVVGGNLRIGRGCIIRPDSVVLHDIPDYCEVSGNPARVVKVYMPLLHDWVAVGNEAEAAQLLEQRRNEPPQG
ncbi:acyltransferase [Paenibacillus enshidis]|uniref:Acyltransferase n=1 Tax=Paenibacillus enshidis TaxID=1458439 RepID=A0ABV5AZQ5_9BACL